MQKSIYDFETLEDVIDYFNFGLEKRVPLDEVKICGAFGGPTPTEDDDPVFITDKGDEHDN